MLTLQRFERASYNWPQTFKLKRFTLKTLRGVFAVLNWQNRLSSTRVKILAFFLSLLTFLFINPSIGAQTYLLEKVILEKPKAFVTIEDSVGSTQVPSFTNPLQGYISTYFSARHQGIDIPNPYGAVVKPVAEGVVVFAGWSALGYGKLITIRHEGGFESLYAHLSNIDVKLGQKVSPESVIGEVGATGVATGTHLHLEVHFYGQPIDPLTFISQEKLFGD
ncbi:MAG TPA: M23 family metallopeptidase [Candidatus Nanoarchaeia archaeon]